MSRIAISTRARQMIANRPPVLAHERFVADRDNFAGLDLTARFERIEQTNLWGAASSVSGLGSEDTATAAIREALPPLLQRLGARSLLDAPCGDAGWIGRIKLELDYIGIDIVPSLIEPTTGAWRTASWPAASWWPISRAMPCRVPT